jgi:8-oxo-dGTP pyrophosphatase MutT (NUDIX family)
MFAFFNMVINYDSKKAHYVVVTGIVVKGGKYLIVKRSEKEKAFPGKWTVPGGKLEVNDYINKKKDTSVHWYNVFESVLTREVKEETNLEIENIGYVTSMVYLRDDNIPTIIVSLYAYYSGGEIKLEDSLTDYAWVSLEESKGYDLVEGMYEEIEMLDKLLKSGEKMGSWKNH